MRKTGLSAPSSGKRGEKFEINEKLFQTFKENNIEAMEIALPFGQDNFNLDFYKFQEYSLKYGVDVWSYHLPFSDFYDPSSDDASDGMASFKMLIKRAAAAKVKNIVIHASAEIVALEGRRQRMENAKKNLAELCDYTNEKGMNLAVENLPRLCLGNNTGEMIELIEANPNLKVCFDVNHIALGEQKKFIMQLCERISTVHISDYVVPDNHLMPFDGNVDWAELIRCFNDINYQGPFLYECGMAKKDGTSYDIGIYSRLHKKIEEMG